MRKVRQRNPGSRGFPFHLSDFAFRPRPFVANEAAKRIQHSTGCQSLAWQLIPRRNLWGEYYSPREPRPGIRSGGFVVPNT
jgi:hypothetical protein